MAVPILKEGDVLIASIQSALSDADLLNLRDALVQRVSQYRTRGVIVDVTALDVVDSFASRTLRDLAHMIRLIDTGTISGKTAKDVFEKMWQGGEPPEVIVKREGLLQVSDEAAIRAAIAAVMARAADQVAGYRKGKTGTLGWFVGQVMKEMGGKANPQLVNGLLKEALSKEN